MNKISWNNIKNSNYKADLYYCGNSIFSKKAHICRLVSLIDLPGSILSNGFDIGKACLILVIELVRDLSLLLILPIARPTMKFLIAKKIEIIIFNYKIPFVKLDNSIKELSILKIIAQTWVCFIFIVFTKTMHIACSLTGIFIPETGRQVRLIKLIGLKIFEELQSIYEIDENKDSYVVIFSSLKNTQEVTCKYRKLMYIYHPDKHFNSSKDKENEAKQQTQQINAAYNLIIDLDYLFLKDKNLIEQTIFLYKKHICARDLK